MDSRTAQSLDGLREQIEELRGIVVIIIQCLENPNQDVIADARKLLDFVERYTPEVEDG